MMTEDWGWATQVDGYRISQGSPWGEECSGEEALGLLLEFLRRHMGKRAQGSIRGSRFRGRFREGQPCLEQQRRCRKALRVLCDRTGQRFLRTREVRRLYDDILVKPGNLPDITSIHDRVPHSQPATSVAVSWFVPEPRSRHRWVSVLVYDRDLYADGLEVEDVALGRRRRRTPTVRHVLRCLVEELLLRRSTETVLRTFPRLLAEAAWADATKTVAASEQKASSPVPDAVPGP